ncbi:MAG: hypothetical protein HY720_16630 [Planctomycetes bacterium]|nr:hypothetical protein [Planctomycetota bacterium]
MTNTGVEIVRLQLLERAGGMPDYRSTVGPPEGLAPGKAILISIDPNFENILVVAAGDRVIGEVPLPTGGPETVEIDAERIRAGGQ